MDRLVGQRGGARSEGDARVIGPAFVQVLQRGAVAAGHPGDLWNGVGELAEARLALSHRLVESCPLQGLATEIRDRGHEAAVIFVEGAIGRKRQVDRPDRFFTGAERYAHRRAALLRLQFAVLWIARQSLPPGLDDDRLSPARDLADHGPIVEWHPLPASALLRRMPGRRETDQLTAI